MLWKIAEELTAENQYMRFKYKNLLVGELEVRTMHIGHLLFPHPVIPAFSLLTHFIWDTDVKIL